MKKTANSIILTNAALEDAPDGRILLRGVIDAANLRKLGIADYQKKTHSASKLRRLGQAIISGDRLPDIECGMRGQHFDSSGNEFVLHDPCYIIDGLQRKMALTAVAARDPNVPCSVGCLINFNTTETWERQRFEKLATDRTHVAPSVILRNLSKDDKIAKQIHDMTMKENDSILYNRVTWDQHQTAGEVILGSTLYRVIILLHAWSSPPGKRQPHAMVEQVNQIAENIGDAVMISNTRKFFELADYFWGFKDLQKRDGVIQIKAEFLFVMAELMAGLTLFWDGSSLNDNIKIRRLKPRLAITAKLKDWLSPSRDAKAHILIYYKRELNKNRASPLSERPLKTKATGNREAA